MPSNNTAITPTVSLETGHNGLPEEFAARPSTLISLLGIANLDHSDQARALHTVQRSVNSLISNNSSAPGLIQLSIETKTAIDWVELNKLLATSPKRSQTAKASLAQPTPSLPRLAHKPLIDVWGLIVFAHWQADVQIPDALSSGWRKLAEARFHDWKKLALLQLSNSAGIEKALGQGHSAACNNFLQLLLRLQKETTFAKGFCTTCTAFIVLK